MLVATTHNDAALMRSAIDWWTLAGVDQLVDEVPSGWLKRANKPLPVVVAAKPAPLANTLQALVDFLNQDTSLLQAGPPDRRIAASGNPDADLMVVIDMPEMNDHSVGKLISGEAGELFEKMLAALNLTRDTCYIAAICPGRPAGGVLPDGAMSRLAELARDHIGMAAASRLWLMGQTVSRAILGMDFAQARNNLQNFNHNGRNKVAMVSYSPRMLLQSPQRKRAAWEDMQRLTVGNETGA